ncbi:MAG: hypothetical protein AB8G16_04510 [Gammaproteobacteria bacterium]
MQREVLIALTVILTIIAMGASPSAEPVAQQLAAPAANSLTDANQLSATKKDGSAHLEIVGTQDDERIRLTMQLDVAI